MSPNHRVSRIWAAGREYENVEWAAGREYENVEWAAGREYENVEWGAGPPKSVGAK